MDNSINLKNLNFVQNEKDLKKSLQDFDIAWTTYEQYYVYELMVIETDARRFIINSI